MSNRHGYIGTVGHTQAIKSNSGVFSPNEIIDLDSDNVWLNAGQLELIETQSVTSSTASVIFSDIKQNEYDTHFATWNNFQGSTHNRRLILRFYEEGVEESASVYESAYQGCRTDGFGANQTTGEDSIFLSINTSTAASQSDSGYVYIYNAGDGSKYTYTTSHSTGMYQNGPSYSSYFGGGILPQASVVDKFNYQLTKKKMKVLNYFINN